MSKIKPIIEGYVKYKDGKKWKKRYCVLCVSSKPQNNLHLYFGKNYDEFAAHRSQGNSTYSQLINNTKMATSTGSGICGGSKSSVNVFQSLTANYKANYVALSSLPCGGTTANNSTPNPITTELCNRADEACRASLSQAIAEARSVNAPPPVDVVTGFESGCHLDRESNVMLLIGRAGVHAITHQTVDDMFNWAATLERHLIDSSYHVTLCNASGDNCCKISVGLQASLHVQQWRICLVGEPSAGCKFICQWRLDNIDSAYIMEPPSSSVPTSSSLSSSSSSAAAAAAGNYLLGFIPPATNSLQPSTGTMPASVSPYSTMARMAPQNSVKEDRFYLQTNKNNGKTTTCNFTFQVDGHRLEQLNHAIEELMLRRFPTLPPPVSVNDATFSFPYLPPEPILSSSSPSNRSDAIDIRSISGDINIRKTGASSFSPPTAVTSAIATIDKFGVEHRSSATPPLLASSFPDDVIDINHYVNVAPTSQSFFGIVMGGRHKQQAAAVHRKLFNTSQTLERSDAIKIPKSGGVCVLRDSPEKDTSNGIPSSKTRPSVPIVVGSAGSESSARSENGAGLIYPSVKVGAGIITSLTPAVGSSSSLASRISADAPRGAINPTVGAQSLRTSAFHRLSIGVTQRAFVIAPASKLQWQQKELAPECNGNTSSSTSPSCGNYCDRCAGAAGWRHAHYRPVTQKRKRKQQHRPRSAREEHHNHSQEVFAADEDVDINNLSAVPNSSSLDICSNLQSKPASRYGNSPGQSLTNRLGQMFQSICTGVSPRKSITTSEEQFSASLRMTPSRLDEKTVYALTNRLLEEVADCWHPNRYRHRKRRTRRSQRSSTPDDCEARRELLHGLRISSVLGVDGSPLDLLLHRLIKGKSHCLFLLTFGSHYSSFLVHRSMRCCVSCCPHSNFASTHRKSIVSEGTTSLRQSSLPLVSSSVLGVGFCLEEHILIPCLQTSLLSVYCFDIKPAGKQTPSCMTDGVHECPNRSNHQTTWLIVPLPDFFDPTFEGRFTNLPSNSTLPASSITNTTTSSSSPSSCPLSEVGECICETGGVAMSSISNFERKPMLPAQHDYANLKICGVRANTLPWKRGSSGTPLSSSVSGAWTSFTVMRQQQQPRTVAAIVPTLRSFDRPASRKRSQPLLFAHFNSYTTPLTCSTTSQASSPNSPPLSSYCNFHNAAILSSASSNNSSGTPRHFSRSAAEQAAVSAAAGEASLAYVNWPMLINRGGGIGSNRLGVSRGGKVRSSQKGVPPPMPSNRLHPESPNLRRSYCCPSTNPMDVPDEVRDPKRNYALVDLRPSPASSVFPASELQITSRSDSNDPADSSASTLRGAPILSEDGEDRQNMYRRRHSHSLSSALPEPILNYVHVITTGGQASKRSQPSHVSRALSIEGGGEAAIASESWGEVSTSASSGGELGGQSTMTDSATSSLGSHQQPTKQPEMAYTKIDFDRTYALSSVNGHPDHLYATTLETGVENGNSGSKAMRSSRSKAVSCSLRMMAKVTRKKSDASYSHD